MKETITTTDTSGHTYGTSTDWTWPDRCYWAYPWYGSPAQAKDVENAYRLMKKLIDDKDSLIGAVK